MRELMPAKETATVTDTHQTSKVGLDTLEPVLQKPAKSPT